MIFVLLTASQVHSLHIYYQETVCRQNCYVGICLSFSTMDYTTSQRGR